MKFPIFSRRAEQTPTPHNSAKVGDVAATVLLPGDPLRAKYIADNFLHGAREITAVRAMAGYTGTFGGKPVTVMGSGMGGPSAGIYAHEFFAFYGAEKIVRIGTAAGFLEEQQPGDLLLAMTACTDSNYAYQYALPGTLAPSADFAMLRQAAAFAEEHGFRYRAGSIFSSDMYSEYNAMGADLWKKWAAAGCIGQDMETYALYCTAAHTGKRALSITTVVTNNATGTHTNGGFTALGAMIETALHLV